jgi:hypothetical protein
MAMNKVFALFLALGLSMSLNAQKNWYVGFNLGSAQNIQLADWYDVKYVDTYYYDSIGSSAVFTTNPSALAKGSRMGLYIGYSITNSMALELAVTKRGSASVIAKQLERAEAYGTPYFYEAAYSTTFNAKGLTFNPRVCIKEDFKKLSAFLRAGALLGSVDLSADTRVFVFNSIPGYNPTGSREYTREYETGMTFGSSFSGGCGYDLGYGFKLNAELQWEFLAVWPTTAELTAYAEDGVDKLYSLSVNDLKTEFVDSYSSKDNSNKNEPYKILKEVYSLNSFNLLVGISYAF